MLTLSSHARAIIRAMLPAIRVAEPERAAIITRNLAAASGRVQLRRSDLANYGRQRSVAEELAEIERTGGHV